MSTAIFEAKAGGMAIKNDALRDAFYIDGTRLFLLKKEGQTQRFTLVAEITTGWYCKWNEFRERMTFRLASTSSGLADQIAQTSYIGYGVPNASEQVDVFSISFEQRDRVPPNASSVYWKLYGVRQKELRYTVSTLVDGGGSGSNGPDILDGGDSDSW